MFTVLLGIKIFIYSQTLKLCAVANQNITIFISFVTEIHHVTEIYADKMQLIEKVNFLIKDLNTLKKSAKLREQTSEKQEYMNGTRWRSTDKNARPSVSGIIKQYI